MLPGLAVIAPADFEQTRTALAATWDLPGPIYFRIGKDDRNVVEGLDGRFELGRAQVVRHGGDLIMLTMGSVAREATAAAAVLEAEGIGCTVVVVASMNPAPADDLAELLAQFPVALTVEAHYVVGGLGSLACEVVGERALGCRIVRCGVRSAPDGRSGSERYLNALHGLSRDALVETARGVLHESAS